MPVPKSGNHLLLGSLSLSKRFGYYWAKSGHNKNFSVSGDNADCAVSSSARDEEYIYRVYVRPCARGDALGISWDGKQAIDDVLDRAINNKGRTVLVWRENGAVMRRELIGGAAREVLFETQRHSGQVMALDVSVTLRNSIILDPIIPAAIDGDWCDEDSTYWALLVDEDSSMLTQGNVSNLDDYTTLSEFDGAGYARVKVTGRKCMGTVWTADDIVFPNVSPGTSSIAGLIIYHTPMVDDVVVGSIPYTFFGGMFEPDAVDTTLTFRVNAEGLYSAAAHGWII